MISSYNNKNLVALVAWYTMAVLYRGCTVGIFCASGGGWVGLGSRFPCLFGVSDVVFFPSFVSLNEGGGWQVALPTCR